MIEGPCLSSEPFSHDGNAARVLLIEDNPLFRTALTEWIGRIEGVIVCGEVGDARSGLNAVRDLGPDLAIVDVTLPDGDGIRLVREIHAVEPDTPVLILTGHDEAFFGFDALRAGALGYLVKDDVECLLETAVKQTLRNEYFLPPKLVAQLVFNLQHSERLNSSNENPLTALTDREMEVFQWLSKGYGTKQIAQTLGLSVKTIETHRANIMSRLGLRNSEELMTYAISWRERICAPLADEFEACQVIR
jgi:DNA-binding NarL/FixJ family response regulator